MRNAYFFSIKMVNVLEILKVEIRKELKTILDR